VSAALIQQVAAALIESEQALDLATAHAVQAGLAASTAELRVDDARAKHAQITSALAALRGEAAAASAPPPAAAAPPPLPLRPPSSDPLDYLECSGCGDVGLRRSYRQVNGRTVSMLSCGSCGNETLA
jgi:hypothetical protein